MDVRNRASAAIAPGRRVARHLRASASVMGIARAELRNMVNLNLNLTLSASMFPGPGPSRAQHEPRIVFTFRLTCPFLFSVIILAVVPGSKMTFAAACNPFGRLVSRRLALIVAQKPMPDPMGHSGWRGMGLP